MARSVSRKESKVHWLVIFSLAVVVRCVLSCRMPRKWESKRRLELPSPGPKRGFFPDVSVEDHGTKDLVTPCFKFAYSYFRFLFLY